jgi:predicted esterase YcpF (UPF0227 family)
MPQHVFYIHGFNSSPHSTKARLVGQYLSAHHPGVTYHVPALPYDPEAASRILDVAISACLEEESPGVSAVSGEHAPGGARSAGVRHTTVGLIGSSLGGFYGVWAAERFGLPLVLVNPAVRPYELLKDHLGEQVNIYTGERYVFTARHVEVLKSLAVEPVTDPGRYFLLTQTGDETLDYRQAVAMFADSPQRVEQGGSHGFDGFERYLPGIMTFLLN